MECGMRVCGENRPEKIISRARKRERENRIWIINEGGITLVSTHQNITQDDRLLKENGKKEKCVETLHTQICLVPSSFYKHCIHVTKFVRLQNISIRCMSYLSFSSCLFLFWLFYLYFCLKTNCLFWLHFLSMFCEHIWVERDKTILLLNQMRHTRGCLW